MLTRNVAKALLIDGDRILVNKNKNSLGDMCYGLPDGAIYYDLPGGGQNRYEPLEEAVIRECLEESGYTVTVDRLAAVYEQIWTNERFRAEYEQYAHRVFFIFICRPADKPVRPVTEKDLDMLESEWVSMEDVKNIPLYPRIIQIKLDLILKSENVLYLGSERVL